MGPKPMSRATPLVITTLQVTTGTLQVRCAVAWPRRRRPWGRGTGVWAVARPAPGVER